MNAESFIPLRNDLVAFQIGQTWRAGALLTGCWEENSETLVITRANGQTRKVKNRAITSGSHKVFGVETVGREIHVLTGPKSNRRPNRRVKFNDSGVYKGSSRL